MSGKTTMLAAAKELAAREVGRPGNPFVVLAPTLRAANEAAARSARRVERAQARPRARLPLGRRRPLERLEVGDVDPDRAGSSMRDRRGIHRHADTRS